MEAIYEGKAKALYETEEQGVLRVYYKDDATAFNGEKKESIAGKGVLNNAITTRLFELMHDNKIPTHFIKKLSDREQLVRRVDIIPLEVVVRNVAAGSLAKRLGWEEGTPLLSPIVEFYYKDDALGDPLLTEDHIRLLQVATHKEVETLRQLGLWVNDVLLDFFDGHGIDLIDFKLEFGKLDDTIILADEISPDTCRLWDKETKQKLDKDVFRRDLGSLTETYGQLLTRIGGTDQ
ncbi:MULTISPECIES: phosphoribosylaminoimidazolesuccinocarboxamide synthase [unclassified Exiguobacterium]|uniref:phosphoribosylaminoimidazolesuccinocarboxamide synthase n=1 Tax=unclassified Exiguobacterium TaxID=2644629 RepID=UPI00103A1228|nr:MULTISPECIES: phosphoribosylaminoimidazolesuccinocarboxamide synthase [unclassified Exiguobacterium]TCI35193.1 phosphoribosylaminoimidazolesuccinocarboxamide synthase [Exiguobacterium sp. SH4S7]TCI44739.1 phosphoribosylaminoimidazolesuccinocarboxamide synthase [Exiguobacterium sp. SH5S32]TCI51146.1 phosphoribosylaminoimidazolesuccinocarboxamide synthase [Exiguobacterium sp. SH1S4]TCI59889.1 phosphoribosylaminoimidazolesuccinocarboxamide synthase [Exiguobacterium sp. SH0S2]TCI70120.1 phospho